MWGSGAVGASVHFSTFPALNDAHQATLYLQSGSFNTQQAAAAYATGDAKRFALRLKIFARSTDNDFTYDNPFLPNQPRVRLQNAQQTQFAALGSATFAVNNADILQMYVLRQLYSRHIPPTLAQTLSQAVQHDRNWHGGIRWQHRNLYGYRNTAFNYFYENIDYQDNINGIDATNRAPSFSFENEWNYHQRQHKIALSLQMQHQKAHTSVYTAQRNTVSALVAYSLTFAQQKALLNVSMRQAHSTRFLPPMPAIGLSWQLKKDLLRIYANAERHYRQPTLNDLFWQPGGNPDLKPESGYAQEIGISGKKNGKIEWTYQCSVYSSRVKDWIVWLPLNGALFSPQNLQRVWSRGAEAEITLARPQPRWSWQWKIAADGGKSTQLHHTSANVAEWGKQLPYTPQWKLRQHFTLIFKKRLSLTYTLQRVSKSYTDTRNTTWLQPYLLQHIALYYPWVFPSKELHIGLKINNITNENYQTIAQRPLPGRSIEIDVKLQYNMKAIRHSKKN
ncbi:MAG: TonB-dependent receptor [Sphingobacteriales bacterium]|nr:TonB-dependent receptor [Sphingobacteriales bacterium]